MTQAAQDPVSAAWSALEDTWTRTLERVAGMPAGSVDDQLDFTNLTELHDEGAEDPAFAALLKKYGATPGQLALAWMLKRSPAFTPTVSIIRVAV